MGFSDGLVSQALSATGGKSISSATEWILSQESITDNKKSPVLTQSLSQSKINSFFRLNSSKKPRQSPRTTSGGTEIIKTARTQKKEASVYPKAFLSQSVGRAINVSDEVIEYLSQNCDGDARVALNALEISAITAASHIGISISDNSDSTLLLGVTIDDTKEALQSKHLPLPDFLSSISISPFDENVWVTQVLNLIHARNWLKPDS
ncbi:hypothetical protein L1887_08444 [Cichorium endivia]|nr:hypothetical protein L1887_08444 [Cichorium endivia]